MLSSRFVDDDKPAWPLNELQKKMRSSVASKLRDQRYRLEPVRCCVCETDNFEILAKKERYGLPNTVVICRECGLVQNSPRMVQESYQEFYNCEYRKLGCGKETPTAVFFEQQYNNGPRIYDFLESSKCLPPNPAECAILEIGVGAGGLVKFFNDRGFKAQGLDLGVEYLEYGKKNHGLNLETGTIHTLLPEQKFDIIIYRHVFEHILDLNAEVRELSKHLTECGVVYVQVPGIRYIYKSYDFLSYLQIAHVYHFTLKTLANVFSKNGFRLINGSEIIEAVFARDEKDRNSSGPQNDYTLTRKLLAQNELLRPVLPFYWDMKNHAIALLKWLKIYPLIRKIFLSLKKLLAQSV